MPAGGKEMHPPPCITARIGLVHQWLPLAMALVCCLQHNRGPCHALPGVRSRVPCPALLGLRSAVTEQRKWRLMYGGLPEGAAQSPFSWSLLPVGILQGLRGRVRGSAERLMPAGQAGEPLACLLGSSWDRCCGSGHARAASAHTSDGCWAAQVSCWPRKLMHAGMLAAGAVHFPCVWGLQSAGSHQDCVLGAGEGGLLPGRDAWLPAELQEGFWSCCRGSELPASAFPRTSGGCLAAEASCWPLPCWHLPLLC